MADVTVEQSHQATFTVELKNLYWRHLEGRKWVPGKQQLTGHCAYFVWSNILKQLFKECVVDSNHYFITLDIIKCEYTLDELVKIINHVTDHLNDGKPIYSELEPYKKQYLNEGPIEWRWGSFLPSLDSGETPEVVETPKPVYNEYQKKVIEQVESGNLGRPEWNTISSSGLTKEQFVQYAVDVAEQVLPLFEKLYPYDTRPREAIELTRKSIPHLGVLSSSSIKVLSGIADAAASAAGGIADAAASAAGGCIIIGTTKERDAARNAAYAAANTAWAASHTKQSRLRVAVQAACAALTAYAAVYSADANATATEHHRYDNESKARAWDYNLKRLLEYKYFDGKHIWT